MIAEFLVLGIISDRGNHEDGDSQRDSGIHDVGDIQ